MGKRSNLRGLTSPIHDRISDIFFEQPDYDLPDHTGCFYVMEFDEHLPAVTS